MRYVALLLPLLAAVGCADHSQPVALGAQPPEIAKTLPPPAYEAWAPQATVTNIQDWDRVAAKIADGLQANGLLPPVPTGSATAAVVAFDQTVFSAPRAQAFSADYDHNSMFSRQVVKALEHEVYHRGGATGPMHVDLSVSLVPWESRLDSQLNTPRREGVWQATVQVGGRVMSFREPFYVPNSDAGLYVQLPAPPLSPDQALAASARPLSYSKK